jgi:gamma-glutamyl-gamma-aminobutyrate hydrolase PuuD
VGKQGNKRRKARTDIDNAIREALEADEKILGRPGIPEGFCPLTSPATSLRWAGKPDEPQLSLPPPLAMSKSQLPKVIPLPDKSKKDIDLVPVPALPKHRVTLVRDHTHEYPDLCLAVYIEGPPHDTVGFPQMFARALCEKANTVEEADLVVFAGGVDVDPQLYGAKPHYTVSWNEERDTADINTYLKCVELGIPMLGICRGAQFLHVMMGGKLYQHVSQHYGDHPMWAVKDKIMIEKVSSVHHQAVIFDSSLGMELLATCAARAKERWRDPETNDAPGMDVEAFFYRENCIIGIQGHPEYANYPFFTKWSLDQINNYVNNNIDLEWQNGRLRLKRDIIEMRKTLLRQSITKAQTQPKPKREKLTVKSKEKN